MRVRVLNSNEWVLADYRPFASFDLDIDFFTDKLETVASRYIEDGLGPSAIIYCIFREKIQFTIRQHFDAPSELKVVIDFEYPFTNELAPLTDLLKELGLSESYVAWKNNEI